MKKRNYGFIVGVSALAGTLSMVPSVFAQSGMPAPDEGKNATMKAEMDDTAVTAKAQSALRDDKDTASAADAIKVQTNGGVVTLMGDVPTQAAAEHAQMVVARLSGVRDVVNDLKYPSGSSAAAAPSVMPPASSATDPNANASAMPPAAPADSSTTTTANSTTTTTTAPSTDTPH
jgi:hypothetical protein